MRESTVVAEWKAEGRAEGRAEGIAQAKRSDLLLVLGQKFGAAVPADLAAAVAAQADIEVLSRWLAARRHRRIARCLPHRDYTMTMAS